MKTAVTSPVIVDYLEFTTQGTIQYAPFVMRIPVYNVLPLVGVIGQLVICNQEYYVYNAGAWLQVNVEEVYLVEDDNNG